MLRKFNSDHPFKVSALVITVASDPFIYAVLEKVIKTTFLFNFADTLEEITVKTLLCFSHFLTFLASITIGDISIYFHITRQAGIPVTTVTHFSQLLLHTALPLLIKVDPMFQLLYFFVIVELLDAEFLFVLGLFLLIQCLFHLSSVHLLLDAPIHHILVIFCSFLFRMHRDNVIPELSFSIQTSLHIRFIALSLAVNPLLSRRLIR